MHLLIWASLAAGFGCASRSGKPSATGSVTLERMGDAHQTPEWAWGAKGLLEEGGEIVFVNTANLSGDARPEACLKVTEENGRAAMVRTIRDSFTASGQVSELSASHDPSVETFLAFLAQGNLTGVKIKERYWEKRMETSSSGDRELRMRCASKVSIEKSFLDQQMRQAITKSSQARVDVREKLLEAQKEFIEHVPRHSP